MLRREKEEKEKMRNVVLFIGTIDRCREVIKKIFAISGQQQISTETSKDEYKWLVSTKYYDADVLLRCFHSDAAATSATAYKVPLEADAIVFVEPAATDLQLWTKTLSSETETRPSVILVASHSNQEAVRLWALERTAEFVDLDAE